MHINKIMCSLLCAASVVSAPVMAESSLSPGARIAASSPVKRVAPASKKESKLSGVSTPVILLALVALGLFVGLVVLDGDEPSSP